MKNRHRKKYLSYFSIMLLFLAFVQLVPLDVFSSQVLHCPLKQELDEIHICGEAARVLSHSKYLTALFEAVDMPCRLQHDMAPNQMTEEKADDIFVSPANACALDYRQPEDAHEIVPGCRWSRRQEPEAAIQIKYQIYRLFIIVVTMILFLYKIVRKRHRLFDHYKVTLWRNIIYIHNIDGKKERRFSEIMVC